VSSGVALLPLNRQGLKLSRVGDAWSTRVLREQHEPIRPVAAEIKEVLEVDQSRILEIADQVLQCSIIEDGTDHDQVAFDAEFLIRQPQPFVDGCARYSGSFKGPTPDDQARVV